MSAEACRLAMSEVRFRLPLVLFFSLAERSLHANGDHIRRRDGAAFGKPGESAHAWSQEMSVRI